MKILLEKIRLISHAVRIKALVRTRIRKVKYMAGLKSGKTVVSIFGSCRQDSLYENFQVTRIREELTYAHYLEEIIQAVRYCKEKDFTADSFGVFRVDLLGKARLPRKELERDFWATDVFVVEVASLLEYRRGEEYFHHEAYDSKPSQEKSHDPTQSEPPITLIRGNLEDTHAKLDRLFTLIPKERTVLVSHIATRRDTDRWRLNETVRDYCRQKEIEYFDPSQILDVWPLEYICEIEPVISHFTPSGHEIVRDRLTQHILRIVSRTKKQNARVIHKYSNTNSDIGFGDFIFGSIFLKQLSTSVEIPFEFDLTDHPLGKLASFENFHMTDARTQSLYHDDKMKKFKGAGVYISNRRPTKIDAGDRDFIVRTLLKFRPEALANSIKKIDFSLSASEKSTIFHVRLGDAIAFGESVSDFHTKKSFDEILAKIQRIINNFENFSKCIILSDSSDFRNYAHENGFNAPVRPVRHFHSQSVESSESLLDMLQEYICLVNARSIVQISVYDWGSGFSETAAIIGGSKITQLKIESISW